MTRAMCFGLIGWLALSLASPLVAQPFTYQGFLTQNGQPVTNNVLPMTFRLYAQPSLGSPIGSQTFPGVNVQNGLFTVVLDFGAVWTGADRYLEIQVGSTTLSPRVKITPAPYASWAAFAQRPWQTSGSNIFYNDGNVGIGTSTPHARLSLGGDNANTDPSRDIWYGCIEGPELAMYVRGTARLVNGRARIELPDHFRKLADEQGMTVQLTPLSPDSKGLCVVRKGLDGIEVAELLNGRGNYEFDWEVKAVRKEHRDFQVYRPWDEVMPGGTDPAEAWQARLQSIQERQARQQAGTNNKGVQR
jgi:hypothetical protein